MSVIPQSKNTRDLHPQLTYRQTFVNLHSWYILSGYWRHSENPLVSPYPRLDHIFTLFIRLEHWLWQIHTLPGDRGCPYLLWEVNVYEYSWSKGLVQLSERSLYFQPTRFRVLSLVSDLSGTWWSRLKSLQSLDHLSYFCKQHSILELG